MTLNQEAPRLAIKSPRDLALPGRLLSSALSLLDRVNPFLLASQPGELEFDALDRYGQVAGLVAMRDVMTDGLNVRRRAVWRAAYGGAEPSVPLPLTPDQLRRAMGQPFQLKVVPQGATG